MFNLHLKKNIMKVRLLHIKFVLKLLKKYKYKYFVSNSKKIKDNIFS